MKEFVTAVKEVVEEDEEEVLNFKIDGKDLKAYKPKDGQIAMLMVSVSRHRTESESIAGIVDFFVEVMDRESHDYVVERLLDRKDPFGFEEITSIMQWMVEQWTGRPTQPHSVSTS